MIKLPDEKQALIEWLKPQITELENICDELPFGLDEDDAMQLKVMRFALDSLNATAQPVSEQHGKIADALESLLWPNMAIGNKAVILAAIRALRGVPAAPGGQDD